jgi:hypothetical protein
MRRTKRMMADTRQSVPRQNPYGLKIAELSWFNHMIFFSRRKRKREEASSCLTKLVCNAFFILSKTIPNIIARSSAEDDEEEEDDYEAEAGFSKAGMGVNSVN